MREEHLKEDGMPTYPHMQVACDSIWSRPPDEKQYDPIKDKVNLGDHQSDSRIHKDTIYLFGFKTYTKVGTGVCFQHNF